MLFGGSLSDLVNVLLLIVFATLPTVLDTEFFSLLVTDNELRSIADVPWLVARVVLEAMTGMLTVVALIMLLLRREVTGIQVAIFAVVLSLTTVMLLTFYLDQFGAMYGALLQFFSLIVLITYRRWYLENPAGATRSAGER